MGGGNIMSQVTKLIKRYMMSHYNMTAIECLPKKVRYVIDDTMLKMINKQMSEVRLISTTEFESLCNHVKSSRIP